MFIVHEMEICFVEYALNSKNTFFKFKNYKCWRITILYTNKTKTVFTQGHFQKMYFIKDFNKKEQEKKLLVAVKNTNRML